MWMTAGFQVVKFDISEWSFWASNRVKVSMRSAMHNIWRDHLMIMYMHQEEIQKVDIHKIDNKFIPRKSSRKERFRFVTSFTI